MAVVAQPMRSQNRRTSPLSISHGIQGFSADAPMLKRIDIGDSDSDDEPPPALKFSKVTQALLADAPVPSSPPRYDSKVEAPRLNRSVSTGRASMDTPSRAPGLRIVRRHSPTSGGVEPGKTPQRVVQVNSKSTGSASKRSVSISAPYQARHTFRREPTPTRDSNADAITPAPRQVRVVTRSRANSNASQDGRPAVVASGSRPSSRNWEAPGVDSDGEKDQAPDLGRSTSLHSGQETAARFAPSTAGRTRNTSADAHPPGSQRIKRAPITGSFLKSGPVRRGFRRRDSEENVSPVDEPQSGSASKLNSGSYTPGNLSGSRMEASRSRNGSVHGRERSVEPVSIHDFAQQKSNATRPPSRQADSILSRSQNGIDSRPTSRNGNRERSQSRQPSVERNRHKRQTSVHQDVGTVTNGQSQRPADADHGQPNVGHEQNPVQRAPSLRSGQYRYIGPKVNADALSDQENIPPPTFKRNKDQEFKYLGKSNAATNLDYEKPVVRHVDETPVPVPAQQEQRKALSAISGNTPHRAAPAPPPKMSVIDTATATAGASVTKSKKKRNHIVINGKIFTQMGRIGRGGSSDVFCVMAENYKTFALKRVKLDDCDESAVRGYKGEIDLLNKLTEVERVVRLFDWELNEEKQELCVLMEKGDADLSRLLTMRLGGENPTIDHAFTRYHWREMLECVEAVHKEDIVHSDLKPANFLLVQGRLKLIDFGIANAIDTDNTCNVHRDTHVGTPNYMSPESITDTNAVLGGKDEAGRPIKKDMKIGKASDVWSMGCILYQMTYGKPPFAHIGNQISRIMAITNPQHVIEFPDLGIGDAVVPPSLKGVLRKCLNRDPTKRPTCKELLSQKDKYLNPEADGSLMIDEELLGQILTKVVDRCRDPKRTMPTPEEVRTYPRSFFEKIREMVERGG